MTYYFYASKEDKLKILDFIFKETNLKVLELSSEPGQEIIEYKSQEEIGERFDLDTGKQSAVMFNLWSPDFKGELQLERIELNPKYCDGHTFRYITSGWGLIQLSFGGRKDDQLFKSHIGHNSEKRAAARQDLYKNLNRAETWDWKAIEQTSRKLKYLIHKKLSPKHINGSGIMHGADSLVTTEGLILR